MQVVSKTNAGLRLEVPVSTEIEPERSRPRALVASVAFDPSAIEAFQDELPATASLMSNEFLR